MANPLSLQTDPFLNGFKALRECFQFQADISGYKGREQAVEQLADLGVKFPVSGNAAKEVKSSLQRCKNITMEGFDITAGWHKWDTAGLMAVSKGGQATALLSLCLSNLYSDVDAGEIICRV